MLSISTQPFHVLFLGEGCKVNILVHLIFLGEILYMAWALSFGVLQLLYLLPQWKLLFNIFCTWTMS